MYQKMTHTLEDLKKLAAMELRDVNREELVDILKSSIFVKGTQLLIIRKIGKQFAVGLFFKNIHGISSLEIQTIYPCRQISFG